MEIDARVLHELELDRRIVDRALESVVPKAKGKGKKDKDKNAKGKKDKGKKDKKKGKANAASTTAASAVQHVISRNLLTKAYRHSLSRIVVD